MKRTVLSISLLLSTANIYCMDTEKTEPRKLSPLETVFEQTNDDGDTLIHTIVKHYAIVNEFKKNLNPIPYMDDAENISDSDDMKKSLAEEPLKDLIRQGLNRKILADAEVSDIKAYAQKRENSIVTGIKRLHKLQLDLNMQNQKGETALYLAAESKAHKVVQTLLELGANPNIADKTGYTPLMIACAQPYNAVVVGALLNGNADINAIVGENNKSNMTLNEAARICIENTNAILEHLEKQSKTTEDKYASLSPRVKEDLSTLKGPAKSMSDNDAESILDNESSIPSKGTLDSRTKIGLFIACPCDNQSSNDSDSE